MNNTIWKYPLKLADENIIEMPKGYKILCVQIQGTIPCLWVQVNSNETSKENVFIDTFGTGHTMDSEERNYIGSYQSMNGQLVFHVFERILRW